MSRASADRPLSKVSLGRLATAIARRFHPRRIVLFGSYAEGKPGPDSDVDLLVVVSRKLAASTIRCALPDTLSLDIIVRTERELDRRLAAGDPFFTEIMGRGRVLYAAPRARVA